MNPYESLLCLTLQLHPVSQSFPEVMTSLQSYFSNQASIFLHRLPRKSLPQHRGFFWHPKTLKGKIYGFHTFLKPKRETWGHPSCCECKFMDVFELPTLTPMNLWACFTTFEVESTLEVMKWNTTCLIWQLQVDPLGSWVACYEKKCISFSQLVWTLFLITRG